VTIDNETRGYLHSATVEIEANSLTIEPTGVVVQLISILAKAKCCPIALENCSPLAEALYRLGLHLDEQLVALDWMLSAPTADLESSFKASSEPDSEVSKEHRRLAEHIRQNAAQYRSWLHSALTACDKEPSCNMLYNKSNVNDKLNFLVVAVGPEK
jgi:hypothetical protein